MNHDAFLSQSTRRQLRRIAAICATPMMEPENVAPGSYPLARQRRLLVCAALRLLARRIESGTNAFRHPIHFRVGDQDLEAQIDGADALCVWLPHSSVLVAKSAPGLHTVATWLPSRRDKDYLDQVHRAVDQSAPHRSSISMPS